MQDIWNEENILNIKDLLEIDNINKIYKKNIELEILIDNKGLINIYKKNEKKNIMEEHKWTLNRKVSIEEFLDSIPNNIKLEIYVIREGKIKNYNCISSNKEDIGIKSITPIYEKIDWEICLGCCFTKLNMNLIELNMINNINLTKYLLKEYRNKNYVCITHIFRNTDIEDINILDSDKLGILYKINNKEINTMDDLREIIYKNKNSYYNIEFENGKKIILSDIDKKARNIDKKIIEEYNIIPTKFMNKWLI